VIGEKGSTGRRTEEEKKCFGAAAAGGKVISVPGIREQRRRGKEICQGLMRNFWKLQGPVCKTKFPVDLKPEWRNAQNESWRVFQTLQHCFRAQVQKLKTYIFTRESLNKNRI
jgi:hypothetical protein